MSTIFNTQRGQTYDPMPVHLWRFDGTGAYARLELAELVRVTWSDRDTGIAEVDVALTDTVAPLLACDGTRLIVVELNGKRHVSMPVSVKPYNDGDNDLVFVRITTASPRSLLDGERVLPVPDLPLNNQAAAEYYTITGPVETVLKNIIDIGSKRAGHPIVVMPDRGQGPTITVTARFDTVGELIDDALVGTGYRVNLDTWLPGDEPIGDLSLTRPTVVADVVPYVENSGLSFSQVAGDLDSWELDYTRAAATRVIVADNGEGIEQRFELVEGAPTLSPWAVREGYEKVGNDTDDMLAVGRAYLNGHAATTTADINVVPSAVFEFGTDGKYPFQYDIGDIATVDLGTAGVVRNVVTEVTAELTPTSFSVAPKVGTPDTMARDIYTAVNDLQRQVDRTARRD